MPTNLRDFALKKLFGTQYKASDEPVEEEAPEEVESEEIAPTLEPVEEAKAKRGRPRKVQ